VPEIRNPKSLALVLSGGGMFGAYQAGAWKALSREISPDIVVGASVGALNGWYIAGGVPAEELERRWLDPASGELMTYRTRRAPWRAVFDPGPLEATAKFLVNTYPLRLDYGVAMVELPALRRKLVSNADVTWRHLVASCAVPVGFAPVRIGGRFYCDGGLLEATPIWAAVEMGAMRVIAVNASRFIAPPGVPLLIKAVRAIGKRAGGAPPQAKGCPEVIMITPTHDFGTMLDGARWREERIRRWIELGERDAAAALESIRLLRDCG
jgi:NTE family protein